MLLRSAALLLALPAASSYGVPTVQHAAVRAAASRSALLRVHMQEGGQMQIVSEETYGMMLSTLLKTNNSIPGEISANYAMVDYAFMQRLCAAPASSAASTSRRRGKPNMSHAGVRRCSQGRGDCRGRARDAGAAGGDQGGCER